MDTWLFINEKRKKKLDKLNNLICMTISIQVTFHKIGRLKIICGTL